MDKILIFPYNGNAIETADSLPSNYELIGFIDDDHQKQRKLDNGLWVYSREAITQFPESKIVAVPGNPSNFLQRARIINSLNLPDDKFATIVHPNANVSKWAKVGFNVVIMAGVVVSGKAIIHNHVCVLPNAVIHHDSQIEDYCMIGSNVTIAGFSIIHRNCYVGSKSSIINQVEIGEKSLIGIGSNVINSLPFSSKAVGNPARIIGRFDERIQ